MKKKIKFGGGKAWSKFSAKGDSNYYTEFSMKNSDRVPKGLSMVKLFWELDFKNYTEFSM